MKKLLAYCILGLFLLAGCKGDEDPGGNGHETIPKPAAQITTPTNEAQYDIGEPLYVDISITDTTRVNDLKLFIDDTLYSALEEKSQTVTVETKNGKVGFIKIKLQYLDENGKAHADNREVIFFSDITPERKTANIVQVLPHNPQSYTQGLEFYKGQMYEGTGQYGYSLLAQVNLQSGVHMKTKDLDGAYFGEGITVLNDTIFQLTYQSGKCFLYDMDFNPIGEFNYEGEGWGLCNDGQSILMSNGTSEIVWRDPATFEVIKRLSVFEPQSDVVFLNELEMVGDKLLANVYQDNKIVEVDTATGKVLTYIDCIDLVNDAKGGDVLNGIAYQSESGKLYMTGKLWPKMYEVEIE